MVRTTVKRLSAPDEETKTLVLKYFGSDDDATCNTLLDRFVVLHAAVGSGTHTGKTFLLYEGDTSAAPSLDRDFAYVGHDGHVLGQDLEHTQPPTRSSISGAAFTTPWRAKAR